MKRRKIDEEDPCSVHGLSNEVEGIRSKLLSWYDAHKRTLPWRSIASSQDTSPDLKGYSVWVSEVMLQQTQVSTVVNYYNRWMSAWPTVSHLASADLDSVNKLWSGLGYYSRAQRLLQGAQKIAQDNIGFPSTPESLLKVPGVGRYTASAIASIAFGHPVGLVDGNVVRVLSRLGAIGLDSSGKKMTEILWRHADELVDKERPGDFNQSLMELGATLCTPKNPSCSSCPLKENCGALRVSKGLTDIENCHLCISDAGYDPSKGVCNYPVKLKKAKVREESCLSIILKTREGSYVLHQRPSKGLLANLLEFYSLPSNEESGEEETLESRLEKRLGTQVSSLSYVGNVFHQFSHISQTYKVWTCTLRDEEPLIESLGTYQNIATFKTQEEILSSSISTAMKKVLKLYLSKEESSKKQRCITAFFKSK